MKTRLLLPGVCALVFVGAVAPATARADAEAPASTGQLEEIIVTAQKRKENNQTVPVAVTAFTVSQIENTQQRNATDLSAVVPNLEISQSGSGPNASLISLRGLSFQDIEKSFEPPIGVVMDGVYLATSTGQITQVFDFDHLEVAAGPQGTLFGKNTTGGVINITRTRPDPTDDEIHGKVRLTGGNFGEHDGEAVVTVPVIQDILAVKFAGFSENNDGPYRDPTLGHNVGKRDYQAYSFAADFRPTDKTDIYFIYDRTLDHSELPPDIYNGTSKTLYNPVGLTGTSPDAPCSNPYLPNACPFSNGVPPNALTYQNGVDSSAYNLNAFTLNITQSFDTFKLISITGYRYSTEQSRNDYDGTQYTLFETSRPESYRQSSEELRYESEYSGPYNFVFGAYYFNSGYTLVQRSFLDVAAVAPIPTGVITSNFGQYTHQSSMNEALFYQGTYDFTDQLRGIVGMRQSWDQKTILYNLTAGGTLDTLGAPYDFAHAAHSWAQFTPKIGFEYKWTPDAMTYFTYSKGYNSGGFNGRAGDSTQLGPYAPEQVHSYEVGAKTSWFENRLRVNVAAFLVNFNNAQEDIIQPGSANATSTTVLNAASVQYEGVEMQLTAKPMPNWTLNTNLGYLDAHYESFSASIQPGAPVTDNTGLVVRRTPPWTVSFASDYVVPFEAGQMGFNVGIKYVDGQQFDLANDPRGYQGPVTKLDAAVRYNVDLYGANWTATLYGKNLTDQTPINTIVPAAGFASFWTEDIGRTYGFTLQANF